MVSYISIFRKYSYFLIVLGIGTITLTLNYWYSVKFNPEVLFWKSVVEEKMAYSSELEGKQKSIFVGGSSCAFSIDCEKFINQHNLSVLNMGIHAGAGRRLQLELGLLSVEEGDLLVLAFETDMWSEEAPFRKLPLGSKLQKVLFENHEQSLVSELGYPMNTSIGDIRIGSRHFITRIAKLAVGRPAYRYSISDIKKGGFVVFDKDWPSLAPAKGIGNRQLSLAAEEFLVKIQNLAKEKKFKVAISFPWQLVDKEIVEEQQAKNRALVEQLSKHVPVLTDETYGVVSDENLYADTNYHLTRKGAELRCEVLAPELMKLISTP